MELIMKQATQAGFSGGLVVDYPHSSKAKKCYLCLFAGVQANHEMPQGYPNPPQTFCILKHEL